MSVCSGNMLSERAANATNASTTRAGGLFLTPSAPPPNASTLALTGPMHSLLMMNTSTAVVAANSASSPNARRTPSPAAPPPPPPNAQPTAPGGGTSQAQLSRELRARLHTLIDEFLAESGGDAAAENNDPATNTSRALIISKHWRRIDELKLSNEQTSELIYLLIVSTLSRSATDRHNASQLFIQLSRSSVLASGKSSPDGVFLNGLKRVLANLGALERELACVKSNVSWFAARGTCDQLIAFGDLAGLMRTGAFYPLFFLCMQNMHKLMGGERGREWVRAQLDKSKVSLVDMLPAGDERSQARLVQILEDRELAFVMPMHKLEAVLLERVAACGTTCDELRQWIEGSVEPSVRASTDFIQSLVTW
jgi:hypothetical protein